MTDRRLYRVGALFSPDRTTWPQGTHLWMDDDGVRLAVFLTHPTASETTAIDTGKARFAWTEQGINGFLLFKYGDMPCSDAPFNPQRLATPFALPPISRGAHRPVVTFLVDAGTGHITAIRILTWPAYFLNHVIASVRRLETRSYAELAAQAAQADFYRRYPDGPSLDRLIHTLPPDAHCVGGQREDQANRDAGS